MFYGPSLLAVREWFFLPPFILPFTLYYYSPRRNAVVVTVLRPWPARDEGIFSCLSHPTFPQRQIVIVLRP